MQHKFIPVTGPSITAKEVRYVTRAAKDGWNENHSKYVNEFSEKFAAYVGRRYALPTSNCTGSLHLAYRALGIKKGDEVIVPNITWVASIEPLCWIGARLVFADIDPVTWCISPKDIEDKVTKKTKAILVVDLYGSMPDMQAILRIAKTHHLFIIEDAAEAIGCEYRGRKAGSFGDVSCFSFHGSKTLTTGEGGMLLTDHKAVIEKARYYNDHCKDPNKPFWTLEIGYKYKMSNFQAACGVAQLERVQQLIQSKRDIFSWYKKELGDIPSVQLNAEPKNTFNSYWMVTAVWDKSYCISKGDMMKKFEEYNIQTRPFFYPLTAMPAVFLKHPKTPVAEDISSRAVNLPCGQHLSKKDVAYICRCFIQILHSCKKTF